MNDFRYQLEKYRGRGSRYVCPQCGRKYTFTRYIDTHNNNEYVNDKVGKCHRVDKCGYHYTPHQYFEDNPWRRDNSCPFVHLHRENGRMDLDKPQLPPQPKPYGLISQWVLTLNLRTHCEMFRFAQHDILSINNVTIYVILNVVKNLSVGATV